MTEHFSTLQASVCRLSTEPTLSTFLQYLEIIAATHFNMNAWTFYLFVNIFCNVLHVYIFYLFLKNLLLIESGVFHL